MIEFSFYRSLSIRVSRSAKRYPARMIRLSAMRLAVTTYPAGSTGAAATVAQSLLPAFRIPIDPPFR